MASMFIVGCSKTVEIANTQEETGIDSTVEFVDQPAINPDIGMLDDIPVSEELPQ